MPMLTTEQEYKRSDLVIQGKALWLDTVYTSNTLLYDRKGIKLGKHKYSVSLEKFVRVRMLVEKQFKTPSDLPDTVYILTPAESDACSFPFESWLRFPNLPAPYYQFIIYGDKWMEKKVITTKKGNRDIKQIKETLLPNTFFTSVCRRTRSFDTEEIKRLQAIKD
jgi:hypothetical protein